MTSVQTTGSSTRELFSSSSTASGKARIGQVPERQSNPSQQKPLFAPRMPANLRELTALNGSLYSPFDTDVLNETPFGGEPASASPTLPGQWNVLPVDADVPRQDDAPAPAAPALLPTLDDTGGLALDALAANFAGLGTDDGIFDVILPTGERVGVAVNTTTPAVRYLVNVDNDALRERLKRCRMELQGGVERRIHRNVEIAVL